MIKVWAVSQLPRLVDERAVAKETARVTERNRRLLGRPAALLPHASKRPTAARPAAAAVLLHWIRAVTGFYGVAVDDFGVSFADGRVTCLLVRSAAYVEASGCFIHIRTWHSNHFHAKATAAAMLSSWTLTCTPLLRAGELLHAAAAGGERDPCGRLRWGQSGRRVR